MTFALRTTAKGVLYVESGSDGATAVRLVPPRCWSSSADGTPLWSAVGGPPFSIGRALRELAHEDAGHPVEDTAEAIERRAMRRRFFASLDDATRVELMRWGGGTWDFYRLLARSPEARELATTEDGRRLAWVCAQADMLFAAPWKKARAQAVVKRLLHRPRREIVGALGLPSTNATVRTIARLVPATMNRKALRMLCWVLADERARARAAHLPKLPGLAIGTLASPHLDLVGDGLLHELTGDDRFEEDGGTDGAFVSEILSDSVDLGRALGRDVPVFHGLKPLLRFYEHVVADHRREMSLTSDPLPAPPDVFTPEERSQLRPLLSLAEWGAEGRLMRHCLAANVEHCRRATEGTLVAWALEGPERLTFAVEREENGAWRLFDLKGEQNRAPSARARTWAEDVVRRLNGAQAGRGRRAAGEETPCTSSSSTTAAA
jgi:hypothetical protein